MTNRVVVCAACRKGETTLASARHFDYVMRSQIRALDPRVHSAGFDGWEQGFIDQHGEFMTRWEAYRVAKVSGQLNQERNISKDELYSEGLY